MYSKCWWYLEKFNFKILEVKGEGEGVQGGDTQNFVYFVEIFDNLVRLLYLKGSHWIGYIYIYIYN